MKMKLLLFLLFTCSFCSTLEISPIFYGKYHSEGGIWKYNDTYAYVGGWGIHSNYKNKNLIIKLDFYNNRFFNIFKKPQLFSKNQGLSRFHRSEYNPNEPTSKFDFDVSNAILNYKIDNFLFYLGKFNSHWGFGESSITISNKSPSFPKFGVTLDVNERFQFEYFHGILKSNIPDSLNQSYYQQDIPGGNRSLDLNRFVAAHRLKINLWNNLNIYLNEMVIYGVRNLDLYYSIPFVPFWSIQHYLGDTDNILMSVDVKYNINNNKNIYGTFLIDEWMPSKTFSKSKNRNWFGYQLGLNFSSFFIKNDNFIFEFNWMDHRTYRHRYNINDYYNHDYPIGFWGGPHSQETYLKYSFSKYNLLFTLDYSLAKRGVLTDLMLENQYLSDNSYVRFEDGYEQIENLKLSIEKYLYKGLNSQIGINFINWENANFDIDGVNNQNLINVNKISFFFGISYNYDLKKQESFLHKDSYKYVIN